MKTVVPGMPGENDANEEVSGKVSAEEDAQLRVVYIRLIVDRLNHVDMRNQTFSVSIRLRARWQADEELKDFIGSNELLGIDEGDNMIDDVAKPSCQLKLNESKDILKKLQDDEGLRDNLMNRWGYTAKQSNEYIEKKYQDLKEVWHQKPRFTPRLIFENAKRREIERSYQWIEISEDEEHHAWVYRHFEDPAITFYSLFHLETFPFDHQQLRVQISSAWQQRWKIDYLKDGCQPEHLGSIQTYKDVVRGRYKVVLKPDNNSESLVMPDNYHKNLLTNTDAVLWHKAEQFCDMMKCKHREFRQPTRFIQKGSYELRKEVKFRKDLVYRNMWNFEMKEGEEFVIVYGRPLLVAEICIGRQPRFWIVNVVLPNFTFVFVSTFALAEDLEQGIEARLAIVLAMMLTSVAYKYTLSEVLPEIPYLTALDIYLICCHIFMTLLATWVSLAPTMVNHEIISLPLSGMKAMLILWVTVCILHMISGIVLGIIFQLSLEKEWKDKENKKYVEKKAPYSETWRAASMVSRMSSKAKKIRKTKSTSNISQKENAVS